ncbi:hypothetical protein CY34DRAFT_804684 [Suillus luteus UH-Slu-Lm8-n1]|uniref:Uncharacterized protein n=1 Tax=Suillus luteus UH-Slu-Lm8-n1 TaxID=930992 RepID=A0A0D0BHG4_9AGAM|nr:hypothetical protein CY34DRAFT_804684 [Suillus luteus UH-Slu-Lm8-n1]
MYICNASGLPTKVTDVPPAQAKEVRSVHFLISCKISFMKSQRNAAAGAPKKDEDIVPDEYLDPPSPNPNSQQQTTAVQSASGEHGGDRSCFCF